MKILAVIPARYAASRFPGKLLQKLGAHSIIVQTLKSVQKTTLFDEVLVATDDDRIYQEVQAHGGKAVMTSAQHHSGSDRIAEVLQKFPCDVVVNIQGDEPFTQAADLQALIDIYKQDVEEKIQVATLMEEITDAEEINNPNNVKVVMDNQNRALYFSRAPIPFYRENQPEKKYYKHIGIYAYRAQVLLAFTQLPPGTLEQAEKLEQLRYLENGFNIQLELTTHKTIGIDTPEDLEKARIYLHKLEQ